MSGAAFYALLGVASGLAIAAELLYGRHRGKRWHAAADTAGNLNLAAGNVVLGALTAGIVLAGYGVLHSVRIADVSAVLPGAATLLLAIVVADFLQYWNHRLSHRWNLLWWGHITHHSSSHLNLSTGIRVNWIYRAYAWVLYAPMPLLGFSIEEFLVAQTVINVYNLFMHTRWNISFGPLRWVLVTPMAHRLHHAADPRYFGNYGAALIVWDRLFGTYRELDEAETQQELAFGVQGRNVDSADPVRLNFDYLLQLWNSSREQGRPFLALLLSRVGGERPGQPAPGAEAPGGRRTGPGGLSPVGWLGVLAVTALAHTINHTQVGLPWPARTLAIVGGVVVVVAFGWALERRAYGARGPGRLLRKSASGGGSSARPPAARGYSSSCSGRRTTAAGWLPAGRARTARS